MVPFSTDRSEWHTPVASILTFTSPGAHVDELDVVPDLERVVADVAEQCSAHVCPPGGWSRTGTRSSLTLRQKRKPGGPRAMSGFYKYAQAEPDFVAVVDPDGTEHTAGDLLGPGQPVRPPAALARAREGRQRGRGAPERGEAGGGLPRRAAGRLVLRADQLPALGPGDRLHHPGLRARRRSCPTSATPSVIAAAADEAGHPGRGPPRPRRRCRASATSRRPSPSSPTRCPTTARPVPPCTTRPGTTGKPKGVKRKLNDVDPDVMAELFTGFFSLFGIPHREDQVHLCTSPNYHTAVTTFAGNALNSGPPGRVHGQVGPGRDARQDRALLGHPHPHGADPVPPDAAAPRGREVQVRRVVDALGHPRRGAVPHRREAEDARLVGPGDLGVLRRHRGRRHDRHPRGLAEVPGHGRQPVGDLRAQDHRRRRRTRSTPGSRAPSG